MLKAEHTAEQGSEYHCRDTAREKNSADRHFLELPHNQARNCDTQALTEVGKHYSENYYVGDRDEQGRVNLVILRNTVHFGVILERPCKENIFELNGRTFVHLVFSVGKVELNAADFLKALFKLLFIFRRDPADYNKAVVVLQRLTADSRVKVKLLEL